MGTFMVSIIVPTCKSPGEIEELKENLINSTSQNRDVEYIFTCKKVSAAENRNIGLKYTIGSIIVMIDDDISGFFPGWLNVLLFPLYLDPIIIMVSARLMKPNGQIGYMLGDDYGKTINDGPIVEIKDKLLPGAAIAYRRTELKYNEDFIGSGYEDTAYCLELRRKYPDGKFVIVNNCPLIHKNEQKNQMINYKYNQEIMNKLYPEGW